MSDSQYLELPPPSDLAEHVACTWIGRIGPSGVPYTDRVLPDGCIDIIWNGSWLGVAGPDTGPVPLAPEPGITFVGIRFRPGRAPGLLGIPACELRDLRPNLADLWDRTVSNKLAERLADAASPEAAAAVFEATLRARLVEAPPADRLVDVLVATLRTTPTPGPGIVARLAAHFGVSERTLHRRCTARVGYGPKTLELVLRFRRFLDAVRSGAGADLGLAGLAAASGYADQAHLARECQRLAGQTPSELFKTRS